MTAPPATTAPSHDVLAQRGTVRAVIILGVLGLLVSLLFWRITAGLQQGEEDLRFERATEQTLLGIEDTVADYDEVLYGLRGSIVSDNDFDRQQFHNAVVGSGLLGRLPGIQSVQYAVPVDAGDGERFVARANAEAITGQETPPMRIDPPLRPGTNYVIDYVEPLRGNEQALGLNLSALPGRAPFIDAAKRTGELVNSAPFPLVLQGGDKIGYVAYLPVYETAFVPATVKQREANFKALVNGVFVPSDLFAGSVPASGSVSFAIYDEGATGAPQEGGGQLLFESQPGLEPQLAKSTAEVVNGTRLWRVYFFAGEQRTMWLSWLVLLGSLLGTGLLMLYVYSVGRSRAQAHRVAAQIAESERRFAELSLTDPLTGLANRRSLMTQLGRMAEVAQNSDSSLAVMFLDVDSFKSVNDVHGHRAGDALLVEVGQRLTRAVRGEDLVGRLSGDEFCVAAVVADRESAAGLVQRVDDCLRPGFELGEMDLPVSTSVGVVVTSHPDKDVHLLLDAADNAMYEAKSRGGGEVVWFDEQIAERSAADVRKTMWIQQAIDDGAFALQYQPVVDLASGEVLSVEALLRLRTSDGLIGPDEFLDFAERTHLIRPLGMQVIRRAVQDRAQWQLDHPDSELAMAINVSAVQAADPATLRVFAEQLQATGLPASLFCFELTETAMFGTADATTHFVASAREIGANLAIDDFGVGYSNLQALSHLDFECLKIDRSLLQTAPGDPREREILASIARMVPQFDVKAVIEGVETIEQLDLVRELGFTVVQGFLFARPQNSIKEALSAAASTVGQR